MDDKLSRMFERIKTLMPETSKNATPIGCGTNGIVITYPDNTVRKISNAYPNAVQNLKQEIHILRLLTSSAVSSFTPQLIGDIELNEANKEFAGSFLMTKVPGHIIPKASGTAVRTAGKLLAEFHKGTKDLPVGKAQIQTATNYVYPEVYNSSLFNPVINAKILTARNFLETAELTAGTTHGDYWGGNIHFNDNDQAIGIVDVASVAHSDNILTDFMCVPEEQINIFIEGYESVSRHKIDEKTLAATHVIYCSDMITHLHTIGAEEQYLIDPTTVRMNKYLETFEKGHFTSPTSP